MNEVLHANIFFVIASIATVVFCILVSVILFQVWKIVKAIRSIIERVEAGSELLAEDMAQLRESVASGGFFARVVQFFMGSARRGNRSKKERD